MQAFGSDRVRRGEGEARVLSCRWPKGWQPRVARTLTTPEHPGTAVLWEDRYYEVVSAEALPQDGVRYVLQPWADEHTIRVSDRYDEESEAQRASERERHRRREHGRRTANLLGVFTGHLPAAVQERMASELGTSTTRLTLLSTLPPWALAGLAAWWVVRWVMDAIPVPLPFWGLLVIGYMAIDSAIRFLIAMTQSRPIGSLPGLLAYAIWYAMTPNRAALPPPFTTAKGHGLYVTTPDDQQALHDTYKMFEPLLALLSPAEQELLTARFGFERSRHGAIVAALILLFSLLGVASSGYGLATNHGSFGPALSLVTAAYLAGEQIFRLWVLQRRPAGSILGFAVRPLVRKLI